MTTPILRARKQTDIKRCAVAAAIGWSEYWLGLAEEGKQPITPEQETGILKAIRCLVAFERAMMIKRQEFIGSLKLPSPAHPGVSRPQLPGD